MQKQVIEAIIEIFGMFVIGGCLRHFKFLKHDDLDTLSKLVFDVLFPVLVFTSMVRELDPSRLKELWQLPLIGFGMIVLGAVLGSVLKKGMRDSGRGRGETFHMFCAVNNFSFLPIIVISNLWGEGLLPQLFIMNVGSTIGLWTVGVSVLSGGSLGGSWRNILTPNIVATVVGIGVAVSGLPLPGVLLKITAKAGGTAVPLILLIAGAALYNSAKNLLDGKFDIVYLSFCRLLLLPLINIFLIKLLHLPEDFHRVAFAVSIMPVSVSATVMTLRYGGSPEFAGQGAVITTVLSIVSMPLLMLLL